MSFLRLSGLHQRTPSLAVVGAILSAILSVIPVHAADAGRSVIGKWKFTAALDSSEITSLDEREAKQLIGHVFTISRDKVVFGSRDCGRPELKAERVVPALYLREQAHASASRLGLPNPVTVVDLGCTVAFIKKSNRLVIHWQGWFFDAVRVRLK